jgi:hypothetical protein
LLHHYVSGPNVHHLLVPFNSFPVVAIAHLAG